jgi:hypothetical protein
MFIIRSIYEPVTGEYRRKGDVAVAWIVKTPYILQDVFDKEKTRRRTNSCMLI